MYNLSHVKSTDVAGRAVSKAKEQNVTADTFLNGLS